MSTSVTMPALGESVSEGTVTRWLKQEGDQVQADEPLLEVSTDKVDTEIPSPASGVLTKIVVGEDETVAVGAELAVIGDSAEGAGTDAGSGAPEQEQQAEQAQQASRQQPAAAAGRAAASSRSSSRPSSRSSRQQQEAPQQQAQPSSPAATPAAPAAARP